jgi:hypothetical protein
MDEDLQRLVGELRNEVCPQRVRQEVARRISSQPLSEHRFHYLLPLATATCLAACCFVFWLSPRSPRTEPPLQLVERSTLDHAQVVAQAEGVLGYIGNALLSASARSERAIYHEALPPLRNSLEFTTDKITQLLKQ